MQYRLVSNLTATATGTELSTGFVTLPMIFEDARTLQFLIPKEALIDGMSYEFRLGFPFPTYTFYTNTIVAKTFDASSPFVSHVQTSSTNSSISVSWDAPEYSDGIVGYSVAILFKTLGNGGSKHLSWHNSDLTNLATLDLALTQTSLTYSCSSGEMSCITPYTTFKVEISVIRETGQDTPTSVFVATSRTVIEAEHKDIALYFFYGKTVTLTFVDAVPYFSSDTVITSTFLHPAYLRTAVGEVHFQFINSTVQSLSSNTMRISMPQDEWAVLYDQTNNNRTFSTATFYYGSGKSIPVSYYCLCTCEMISVSVLIHSGRSEQFQLRWRMWAADS